MNVYYFITAAFLLLSAKANFLYHDDIFWFGLDLLMIWVGMELRKIQFRDVTLFLGFAGGYVAYMLLRNFLFNYLPASFLLGDLNFLFKFITFSFLYCMVVREQAVHYIPRVIFDLAVISIPFYLLQVTGQQNIILGIAGTIDFAPKELTDSINFLVFNYNEKFEFRNSGFCWEPGAFGSFLVIGLMLHLFNNQFAFRKKDLLFVLIIITTLSTTAYLGLFFLCILYYRKRNGKIGMGFLAVLALATLAFFKVPVLQEKIMETFEEDMARLEDIDTLITYYDQHGEEMALNRFSSAVFLYSMFGIKIIWGISNQYAELFNKTYMVSISNGLVDFSAKFGIIGLTYFFYRFGSFCRLFVANGEQVLYCILTLAAVAFGEPILILPVSLIFLFLRHFITIDAPLKNQWYPVTA